MPIEWKDSYVDRLMLNGRKRGAAESLVSQVRSALDGGPIGPDSAKILTAIAADIVAGIENRDHAESVQAAHLALKNALSALEAMTDMLDG